MLQRVKVSNAHVSILAWAFTRILQHRLSPIPQRSVDEVKQSTFSFSVFSLPTFGLTRYVKLKTKRHEKIIFFSNLLDDGSTCTLA